MYYVNVCVVTSREEIRIGTRYRQVHNENTGTRTQFKKNGIGATLIFFLIQVTKNTTHSCVIVFWSLFLCGTFLF